MVHGCISMQKTKPGNFIHASKSIASSAASLLGSNKSVKCILDANGSSELTSSTIKLLQIIDVEHPAISVIHDACQGLHKYTGTGCATLVFMVGSWLKSFERLADEGISLAIIHQLFDEALSCCLEKTQKLEITIKDLVGGSQHSKSISNSGKTLSNQSKAAANGISLASLNFASHNRTNQKGKQVQHSPKKKVFSNRYSRHLMNDEKTKIENEDVDFINELSGKLSFGFSRGNSVVAKLLECILRLVLSREKRSHGDDIKLSTDDVFTEIVTGKECLESFVFDGLCFSTDTPDINEFLSCFEEKFVKIVLLDFDQLSYSSEHVRIPNRNKKHGDKPKVQNEDNRCNILSSFGISCVLFKGDKPGFIDDCQSIGIVAIHVSSHKRLQALSIATGTTIISSLEDLDKNDIGRPVKVSVIESFRKNLLNQTNRNMTTDFVSIDLGHCEMKFTTVVLCAKTTDMAFLLEESFWGSFCKLRNVLNHGKCIHGCGETEMRCAEHLRLVAGSRPKHGAMLSPYLPRWMSNEVDLFRGIVYNEFAMGLERYCSQLEINTQNHSSPSNAVFDDLFSKTEAWKRAIRLVKTITKVDMVITTGINEAKHSVL